MTIETCLPAEAAATEWDAIIVGAGPAGSVTALRLAKAGRRVLLVDRDQMPRGKVCGCCLSQAAIRELRDLEVIAPAACADIVADAVPLEGVCLAAWGRTARIPLVGGRILSREVLDTSLVAAAVRAGARWLPEANVVAVADEDGSEAGGNVATVTIRMAHGGIWNVHGDFVVIAAGLADHVRVHGSATAGPRRRATAARSRIGVGAVLPTSAACPGLSSVAELLAGELIMAVGHHGYCGIVRLEDGRIDLAAAVDRQVVNQEGSPATAIEGILREAFGGSPRFPPGVLWRATPPLSHASPLVAGAGGRIFRIGDAAGYVEPFTGEGIGWALASGRLVAESILHGSSPTDVATRYERGHAAHFNPRYARCRRVARGLRIPVVVAATVRAAGLMPWAARLLAPAVVGHDASDARLALCEPGGFR